MFIVHHVAKAMKLLLEISSLVQQLHFTDISTDLHFSYHVGVFILGTLSLNSLFICLSTLPLKVAYKHSVIRGVRTDIFWKFSRRDLTLKFTFSKFNHIRSRGHGNKVFFSEKFDTGTTLLLAVEIFDRESGNFHPISQWVFSLIKISRWVLAADRNSLSSSSR